MALLSALEVFEVELAKARVLDRDEQAAIEGDFTSLYRVTPKEGALAATLLSLEDAGKKIIYRTKLSDKAKTDYHFGDMLEVIQKLTDKQVDCAIDRWNGVHIKTEADLWACCPKIGKLRASTITMRLGSRSIC